TVRRADAGVPYAAFTDDRGDVGVGFHVVDHGRLAVQAGLGGERRARTRLAALAFHGGDKGGFLAAYKRPGPHADLHVEAEIAAQDALAEQGLFTGLVDRQL